MDYINVSALFWSGLVCALLPACIQKAVIRIRTKTEIDKHELKAKNHLSGNLRDGHITARRRCLLLHLRLHHINS